MGNYHYECLDLEISNGLSAWDFSAGLFESSEKIFFKEKKSERAIWGVAGKMTVVETDGKKLMPAWAKSFKMSICPSTGIITQLDFASPKKDQARAVLERGYQRQGKND